MFRRLFIKFLMLESYCLGRVSVSVLLVLFASAICAGDFYSLEPAGVRATFESRIDQFESENAFAISNRVSFESTGTQSFNFRASVYSRQSHCRDMRSGRFDRADRFLNRANQCESLGELNIGWRWRHANFSIGRQKLETPHLATDESLVIANTFESLAVTINPSENLSLSAYYVDAMMDFDSRSDTAGFTSLGRPLDSDVGDNAGIFAVRYAMDDAFSAQVWFYHIDDIENILYFEFAHNGSLNANVAYDLGVQYSVARSSGRDGLGNIEANTLGVAASLTWSELKLFAAYNLEVGETSAPSSIGGGPFFTSMEQRSIDSIGGEGGQALLFGVNYVPFSEPLAGVEMNLVAGRFTDPNPANYDVKEFDIGLSYQVDDNLGVEVNYSHLSDEAASVNDNRLGVVLSVAF